MTVPCYKSWDMPSLWRMAIQLLKKLLQLLPNQMMNLALHTPLESGYYKKCTITS